MNVAAGPKLAAAVTNAGKSIAVTFRTPFTSHRWHGRHWRCSTEPQIPPGLN